MKKVLFTLLLLCLTCIGTVSATGAPPVSATRVVATMKTLIESASSSNLPLRSTLWTSTEEGGYVYNYNGTNQYFGGIDNADVAAALKGDGYVTVAAWVYGIPSGSRCIFGYGENSTGIKFMINGTTFKTTTKGVHDFEAQAVTGMQAGQWNLVAFAFPGKGSSADQYRYYSTSTNNTYWTKTGAASNKMNDAAEEKCAVGSGDQNVWREGFSGNLANLIVIESAGLLNNGEIAQLVGAAPSLTIHAAPDMAHIHQATWYQLNVREKYIKYDAGSKTYYDTYSTQPDIDDTTSLFAFVGNTTDGFKIVNYAAGPLVAMGADNVNTNTRLRAVNFSDAHSFVFEEVVYNGESALQIREKNNNNAFLNQQGTNLGYWNQNARGDLGNVFVLTPNEDLSLTPVTYNFTAKDAQQENTITWSSSIFESAASHLATPPTYGFLSDAVINNDNASVSPENNVFNVTYTHTLPMLPGKEYQIKYGNTYMQHIDEHNVTLKAEGDQENGNNVWYIKQAGNTFSFYLYNKATGTVFNPQNDSNNACTSGEVADPANYTGPLYAVDFVEATNGFYLYKTGTNGNLGAHGKINNTPNSALGLWNIANRNGGTVFTVEEVVQLTTYTVSINVEEGSITIGEQTLHNGDTYRAVSVSEEEVTVNPLEHYTHSITVTDNAITVTYTPWPTWTVSVTGCDEGRAVYKSEEYADGTSFQALTVAESEVTAKTVAGYSAAVSIAGQAITVAYTQEAPATEAEIDALTLYANVPGRPLATSDARKALLSAINVAKVTGNEAPLATAKTNYNSTVLTDATMAGPVAGTEYIVYNYTTGETPRERYLGASGNNYTLSTTAPTTNAGYWTVEYTGNRFYLKNASTSRYLNNAAMAAATSGAMSYAAVSGPENYTNGYLVLQTTAATATYLYAYNNPPLTLGTSGAKTTNNGGKHWSSVWRMQEVNPVLPSRYAIVTTGVESNEAGIHLTTNVVAKAGQTIYYDPAAGTTLTGAEIKGWESSVTADDDTKTLTVTYTKGHYNVTYIYVDAYDNSRVLYTDVHEGCIYGEELPAVRTFDNATVLNAPTGTVEGVKTYTILVLDNDAEDHPDPTKPENVTLTYRFLGPDGSVWYTEDKGTVANGSQYPAVTVAAPEGVSFTAPTGLVSSMDETVTVDIPCTSNFNLKFADSYDNIQQWYRVTIADARLPFHYNASETEYMALSASNSTEAPYLFALVGSPFTGYIIYNKEAQQSKVLSAPTPRSANNTGGNDYALMRSTPVPDGYNTHWDFKTYDAGFLMSRHGETEYLNNRSGKLAFWTGNHNGGSRVYFTDPDVSIISSNPTTVAPEAEHIYRIYSMRNTGHMIIDGDNHQIFTTNEKRLGNMNEMWVLHSSANGSYTIRNVGTGRFLKLNGNNTIANTDTSPNNMFFISKSNNGTPYYGIGSNVDGSGNAWLNTNTARNTAVTWSLGDDIGSGWVLEAVEDITLEQAKQHVKANGTNTELTAGKYYRLANKAYPTRYMVEQYTSDGKIWGLPTSNVPNTNSQIWQISGDNTNGYTFRNVFTGHYIKDQGSQSHQFETTESESAAKHFTITQSGGSDWSAPQYAFYRGGGNNWGLHCASSQSYWVVTWTYVNADATWWNLEAVELTPEDIETIEQEYADYKAHAAVMNEIAENAEFYNEKLQLVFADAACTELRDNYKGLSNYQLRTVLASLGMNTEIQDMAVAIKNSTWVESQTEQYNSYVKRFRISDYEIYSDRGVWGDITKVGPFAMFTNPTGITVQNGETALIFVGEDPMDSDAKIGAYIAHDTEYRSDKLYELHKGLNVVTAHTDGEFIIDYRLTNANRYWAEYPTIKIHIEGGTANGCWDLHRGMNNEDWAYLRENMFKSDFLHVKGHSTLLNVLTRNVIAEDDPTSVMIGWDFCFDDLQRLIGHDGQWDGRYRPMINPRHSYSGNPNWGGQSGSNHPGITNGYLFRKTNFTEDNVWEILHEEAHGHQGLINPAGMTEISNNSLSQMVSYDWGRCYSRGEAGAGLVEMFNYTNNTSDKQGWTWLDYMRYAKPYYDYSLHVANQMLYHLYLYFDVLGNKPERDFIPRLHDKMRELGGIEKGNSIERPTYYYNDYWRLARACAEVSKTDLWEFFEVYGMWKYVDEVMSTRPHEEGKASDPVEGSEAWNDGIRFLGDYGNYYMKMPVRTNPDDEARMEEMKQFMHNQPNKAPNILFMEDRLKEQTVDPESPVAKLDPTVAGKEKKRYWDIANQGEVGNYDEYTGVAEANGITYNVETGTATKTYKGTDEQTYTVQGKMVTMEGDGLVGVKIYNDEGKLIYISNTKTFFVPTQLAEQLEQGQATLVAALPDNTNLPVAAPSEPKYEVTVYDGGNVAQTYLTTGQVINANIPYTAASGSDLPVTSPNAVLMINAPKTASIPSTISSHANVLYNEGTAEEPVWVAPTLTIADKQDYYAPCQFTAEEARYQRTNTAGWNSVCLPFDVTAADFGEGTKIYTFKSQTDERVTFEETTAVPAGQFCLVWCEDDQTTWQMTLPQRAATGVAEDGGESVGSFTNQNIGEGKYKLNSTGTAFGATTEAGKVTAFRGYLNMPAQQGVRSFALEVEELPEAIHQATAPTEGITYGTDLNGRQTLTFQRGGIYIINGKKTIIR